MSLTVRCDWPDCDATLAVTYRAEIEQQQRWKSENGGDYSRHLCPAHKRKDWQEVQLAQFKANAAKQYTTPGQFAGCLSPLVSLAGRFRTRVE